MTNKHLIDTRLADQQRVNSDQRIAELREELSRAHE